MENKFSVGQKVTYSTPMGYNKEHGIVKSLSGGEIVFVVYNCGGDWDNYINYTGQRTHVEFLMEGWK